MIDVSADENNHGVANIGQAKWMAKQALETIRRLDAEMAQRIEANLVGAGKPIANWAAPATQAELDLQKVVLLAGQLKAIATPFYTELHATTPNWLAAEMTVNGTNTGSGYFPWTETVADDANRAPVTIGQLKAVFALHFTDSHDDNEVSDFIQSYKDSDRDGLDDAFEMQQFGNLNRGANDPSGFPSVTAGQLQYYVKVKHVTAFPPMGQEAILNGDFNERVIGTNGLGPGVSEGWDYWAGIPGWEAVNGSNIELQTIWPKPQCGQYCELKAHPDGNSGIRQLIGTKPGRTYALIFDAAPRGDVSAAESNFIVKIDGVVRDENKIIFTENNGWRTCAVFFTAASNSFVTEISLEPYNKFAPIATNTTGCLVDNVKLMPQNFSVQHIEEVKLEANEIFRDEIVNLIIQVPPADVARQFKLDINTDAESEKIKKETLGSRGDVQMYDFGAIGANGVVTPLTTDGQGNRVEGPYNVTMPVGANGIFKIKAVFNKEGKFKLHLQSVDDPETIDGLGSIDVVSQEFTVTRRIRKYATKENQNQLSSNAFDAYFENSVGWWPDWQIGNADGNYTFKDSAVQYTPELLKAISWKECDLYPKNAADHGTTSTDIMQVNAGNNKGCTDMTGSKSIADWNHRAPSLNVDVVINGSVTTKQLYLYEVDHPKKLNGADFSVRKMMYPSKGLNPIDSYQASVKWALRKLLYKQYDTLFEEGSPNVVKYSTPGAGPTLFVLSSPKAWDISETIRRYGDQKTSYPIDVFRMRDEGIANRGAIKEYRWPTLTNSKARH